MQDPNQGEPDGTEELMSVVRCSMTTPIPPLVGGLDDIFISWFLTSAYIDIEVEVGSHRKHDIDYMPQWFILFLSLQLLTRDESPSPSAEELQELEDGESQLDEWVELQVSGETSPPIEDVDEDLETPTILWAGPAFETVASDELQEQFPFASTSTAPSAQESNNDTEVIKGDTEDVLHSFSVPVSQQTPVTLEESQFIRQVKPPLEEQEMLEVKMLDKEMQEDKLELQVAGPVINHKLVNEETTISQALDPELESVKVENQDVTIALRSEQSLTIVEAAEANRGLDVHHDSEKMSKGGDVSGTTASADCSQELLHSSVVSETTTAVPEDTEEGNSEPDLDACSSFEILHPIEEPSTVQGT